MNEQSSDRIQQPKSKRAKQEVVSVFIGDSRVWSLTRNWGAIALNREEFSRSSIELQCRLAYESRIVYELRCIVRVQCLGGIGIPDVREFQILIY